MHSLSSAEEKTIITSQLLPVSEHLRGQSAPCQNCKRHMYKHNFRTAANHVYMIFITVPWQWNRLAYDQKSGQLRFLLHPKQVQ